VKKIKEVIGVLLISGLLGSIAGGTVYFKCAKLPLALMVGGIIFIVLSGLGLSITEGEKVDKKRGA